MFTSPKEYHILDLNKYSTTHHISLNSWKVIQSFFVRWRQYEEAAACSSRKVIKNKTKTTHDKKQQEVVVIWL